MKSKKRFLVRVILLSLIINLCGCGENETSNQSSLVETVTEESTEVYMPFESDNETVQLKINTDSPLNLTHKDALSIYLSQSELKSIIYPRMALFRHIIVLEISCYLKLCMTAMHLLKKSQFMTQAQMHIQK